VVARAGGQGGPARRRGRELNPLDPDPDLNPEPGSEPDPDSELARLGSELADSVIEALPGWIARVVEGRFAEWSATGGRAAIARPDVAELAKAAGREAAASVAEPLRALVSAGVDDQWTTPLALVRPVVVFATEVLEKAGVPPVVRDEFQVRRFPDDLYGLTPSSLVVLGDEVGVLALAWGATKAAAHLRRHQR
jgi:hypothetical protein